MVYAIKSNLSLSRPNREPGGSVELRQRDQPDPAVQADHAGLQPGGAVQHRQGLAGDQQDSGRHTGAAAAA